MTGRGGRQAKLVKKRRGEITDKLCRPAGREDNACEREKKRERAPAASRPAGERGLVDHRHGRVLRDTCDLCVVCRADGADERAYPLRGPPVCHVNQLGIA